MSKAQKGNKENKKPTKRRRVRANHPSIRLRKKPEARRKIECAGARSPRGNSDRDKLERSNLTGWAAHIALPLLGWPRSTAGPTK